MKIGLLIFFLSINIFAQEDNSKLWAKSIIGTRSKMNPKTEFEKWLADQWIHAAATCAHFAKLELPKEFNKLPLYKAGSFSLPKNEKEFCQAIATGPSPQCFFLRATISPFEFPPRGLPNNYVYMKRLVQKDTIVTVGGECNLVANKIVTKQFFAGKAKVVWRSLPKKQLVQTFNGPRELNMGTIWFDVEGMPLKDQLPSVSAVVIE